MRYRALFDSNPDPVLVVDAASLQILAANPAAARLYGCSRELLCAMRWVDLFVAAERAGVADRFAAHAAGECRSIVKQERRDGSSLTTEIVDNPIAFGGRAARIAVVRDLTEREQLEIELRHAQKMEAMGVFAGGIAHDFNNLLTVIAGCGANLREVLGPSAEARPDLEDLLGAAERASSLTKRLLLFSQRLVLRTGPIDLVQVIEEMRSILRRLLGAGIELDVHHAAPSATVLGDRVELEQLVSNIVVNAGQAIVDAGRVSLRTSIVDVEASPAGRPGRYVELEVSDDGRGMDDATLARVFDPFFTTKVDGTGLGLAVVHGVVKRHHGFVVAESKLGVGTSIRAYLPLSIDAPRSREVADPARGSEHVLVVDDEPSVRRLTERQLIRLGHRVTSAADGEEALEVFERSPDAFAMVVMDVVMPKLGGPAALARMRHIRPGLPALFVSGHVGDATGVAALTGDASTSVLQKPFTSQQLAEEVRRLLEAPTPPRPR